MDEGSYGFKLGKYDCVCLSDGSLELLRESKLPTDHITTPYTYLFVDTGENRVLVDAGAGDLGPSTGKLLNNMEIAGIDRESIDTVVVTHAHPDHIGGILDKNDQPVLPNAYYYFWKREWDYWNSEKAINNPNKIIVKFANIANNTFRLIKKKTELIVLEDGETEILPGVYGVKAPGHTPGHMVVYFKSEGVKLVYIGDTVLYPIHLQHPDWVPVFDMLPDEAADSKKRIFDWVAEEKSWVIGQHFPPFPSLGHVVKRGEQWEWNPINLG
jgi:glyoxylase-like metal-dependent hydrolase (beta-lactamase superfamily II)